MFGTNGRTACDASGNIFFNVGSSISRSGPFLGVSADGRRHAIYEVPAKENWRGNLAWTVTPGGDFYVLQEDFKEYRLIRFKSDGPIDGISLLAIPPGVNLEQIAVNDNDRIYVAGYKSTGEPKDKARPGFAALLDNTGKLVLDLSADAPEADLKARGTHPSDGDVTAGADGRFYVLGSKDVVVLNQSGGVEGDLKFKKPTHDAYARRIDYSKGLVSIIFHSVHRSDPNQAADVEVRALVLDAQTGDQRGDFVFDPATTGSVICFSAQEGYSLLAMDGNMAAKDIVPIR